MLFFDRDKQRLEVSLAKALATLALQDLVENRRAVLDRLSEDLQKIAFVITVYQYSEAFEVVDVLVDLTDAVWQFVVIGVGNDEKFYAVTAKSLDTGNDIVGGNGDVLHAGPLHGPAYIAAQTGFSPLVSMSWGADILHDGEVSPLDREKIRTTLYNSTVLVDDCQAVTTQAVHGYGYPRTRIYRLPWGVDLKHFSPNGRAK